MNSEQVTRLELALQPWQGCVLTIEHYTCMFQCRSPEERRTQERAAPENKLAAECLNVLPLLTAPGHNPLLEDLVN